VAGNRIEPGTVVQRTQYYPSGLPWAEGLAPDAQPYKYNGKEFIEMHGYDMSDYGWRGLENATMRFNTVDPKAEKYYGISPYAYCGNNPIVFIDPHGQDIVYFNLNGKEVKRDVQPGTDVKKMILTTSKNDVKVNTAFNKGFVVSAFSNSESAKMGDIYKTASGDKTKTEQGFIRGTNGESKIVTGTKAGEIGDAQWKDAKADLTAKGSTPTSDVHLHPNGYDASGNMTSYGLPQGSDTDVQPKNNRGYTEPSVVLGYKEEVQPLPSGQIGGTPQVNYTPTVGFYDAQNNQIITISFSDLQSAINKINK